MSIIAVSGGAGFLGSHLVDRLVNDGHEIYVLDNFHTGRWRNLESAMSSGRLHVVEHDIIEHLPAGLPRFDQIYNLACPASPQFYQEDPVATLKVSSFGVLNMLERAELDGARFFHTSTSEVYGDPDVHPQHESYHGNVNPVGPRSCYDEGKRFAEALITDFAQQRGVAARMVRIFNTYGPRMQPDDGRVVSNFIVQALRGENITIYGDGSQTRSFCYVDDMIDGFQRLMSHGDDGAGPMNIGNPVETTVGQLAELIVELTGSYSTVEYRPLPIDDPRKRRPDISRAARLLGWSPNIQLTTGLNKTIRYFSEELDFCRSQESTIYNENTYLSTQVS